MKPKKFTKKKPITPKFASNKLKIKSISPFNQKWVSSWHQLLVILGITLYAFFSVDRMSAFIFFYLYLCSIYMVVLVYFSYLEIREENHYLKFELLKLERLKQRRMKSKGKSKKRSQAEIEVKPKAKSESKTKLPSKAKQLREKVPVSKKSSGERQKSPRQPLSAKKLVSKKLVPKKLANSKGKVKAATEQNIKRKKKVNPNKKKTIAKK